MQIPDTSCMIDVMTFLKGEVGGWFNNVTYLSLAHPSYFVSANVYRQSARMEAVHSFFSLLSPSRPVRRREVRLS